MHFWKEIRNKKKTVQNWLQKWLQTPLRVLQHANLLGNRKFPGHVYNTIFGKPTQHVTCLPGQHLYLISRWQLIVHKPNYCSYTEWKFVWWLLFGWSLYCACCFDRNIASMKKKGIKRQIHYVNDTPMFYQSRCASSTVLLE